MIKYGLESEEASMNMNMKSSGFSFAPEIALQSFIQKVYQWMAAGLALTGFVAYWTSNSSDIVALLVDAHLRPRPLFWGLSLAEIGLVIWLSSSFTKISAQVATSGFLIYAALNGLTLSIIFLAYTGASIASTFFICAVTFVTVSIFGWTTKTDLTSLRGFFFMAIIGLIIASLVNFFFQSPILYWIISYAGVAVFIGLTAYDTQRLKAIHYNAGGHASQQLAIMGALALYLDFINMFLYLLRIFGKRR